MLNKSNINGIRRLLFPSLAAAMLTCVGTIGANTDTLRQQFDDSSLWSHVYSNTAAGGRISGDKETLVDAVRDGDRIGVTWLSWHGEMAGTCDKIVADLDGRLECKVEVWCNKTNSKVGEPHIHRSTLTSSGSVSSMILVPKNTHENKIYAAAEGSSALTWYRSNSDTAMASTQPYSKPTP